MFIQRQRVRSHFANVREYEEGTVVLRKNFLAWIALGALTTAGSLAAQAQSTQLNFTGGVFSFNNGTFTDTTNVVFNYVTIGGSQYAFNPPIQASLTLSGDVGTATNVTLNGTQIAVSAGLTNVTETIKATQSGQGITSGETLVSYSGQSGMLAGAGKTISFGLTSPGNIFTSDVFALYGPENTTLQLTPSSVLSVTGSTMNYGSGVAVTTGTLNAFSATGKSQVFNAASVPEASTLIGLGGLVLGGGLLGLRRRKVA
jgi:hypothetical protein